MRDVMIDLETLDTTPTAAIVSIGAMFFTTEPPFKLGDFLYVKVYRDSSEKCGGTVSQGTLDWWSKQSAEARAVFFGDDRKSLPDALLDFVFFVRRHTSLDELRVWGNGAAFDNVILSESFRRCGISLPWQFWNDRCYRTLKSMHPSVKMSRRGTYHNALDDAQSQAEHLQQIMRNEMIR